MNKKAMELSINFIVTLILAITVFGFGLYFIQGVFTQMKDIRVSLDKSSEENINAMLDRGEKVAFPITSKSIKSGDNAIFGLGVLNVLDDTTEFSVEIDCSVYITKTGKAVEDSVVETNCDGPWTVNPASFTLTKNAKKIVPIAIVPPLGKPAGTYGFTVEVSYFDSESGSVIYGGAPKQIYVTLN